MPYHAPLNDILFTLEHVAGLPVVREQAVFADADAEVTAQMLTEAARICDEVMAPLQRSGDIHPARLENGVVRTSPGFAEGFRAVAEAGWLGSSAPVEFGGMGLPMAITTAANDMMSGACLSLQLAPLMIQGQIEALAHHANEEIRDFYLPRLIDGTWSGTMNLTEPQAGSDVGALATRAEPREDGSYEITGQKIYISWGDTDFCENVCHLVLARLPDGGAGTRGISLFLVPKFLPNPDGSLGARNAVKVVSLEHKLGLHGSPTAVLAYEGATGFRVGGPHQGMKAMFTMMNNARLGVGAQGVGVAEAALQAALAYAEERRQGRTPVGGGSGPIIEHADVRRMLATMRAEVFAARAILLNCATALDMAKATEAADWVARAGLLTPIAKAFGTETGITVADMGLQVHGGMGVIEETGAAQFLRDVRVTSIYEGTNGIQAMDLAGRKMIDGGEAAFRLLDEIEAAAEAARAQFPDLAKAVWHATETLREATEWMVAQGDLTQRFAGSLPFLRGFARVLGGHYHLVAAMAAGPESGRARLARFFILRMLPDHGPLLQQAMAGSDDLYALTAEDLAA